MEDGNKNLTPSERYDLIGRLIEEIKLRKYSYQTGKAYISITKRFLKSGKTPRGFLLDYSGKSRSTMRIIYFTLKFFHEKALHTKFDENLPLAKKTPKLPVVLSREEINKMIRATNNMKHKLILMFLYYAGLRLNEIRNLGWHDMDFDRELIHVKIAKGEKERMIFFASDIAGDAGALRW